MGLTSLDVLKIKRYKKLLRPLYFLLAEDDLDDDELLATIFLYKKYRALAYVDTKLLNETNRPQRNVHRHMLFADFTDAEIFKLTKYTKAGLIRIKANWGLPAVIKLSNGGIIHEEDAILLLLARIAYSLKQEDLL